MKLNNITKTYQNKNNMVDALKGISFSLAEKGLYLIYGASGSGKSTFLNMLAGFETYDKGVIENDHTQIMIFQSYELIE